MLSVSRDDAAVVLQCVHVSVVGGHDCTDDWQWLLVDAVTAVAS